VPLSERVARVRTASIAVACCVLAFGAATVRVSGDEARAAAAGPSVRGQPVADLDRTRVQGEKYVGAVWLASDPLPAEPDPPPASQSQASQPQAPAVRPATTAPDPPQPAAPQPTPRGTVSGIGDSIMLAASSRLSRLFSSRIAIDAVSGRQVAPGLGVAERLAARGTVGETVVVHLGTNGTFSRGQFDAMMAALSAASRVFFVNVAVPRPWEAGVNATISSGVARYPTAHLIDWRSLAAANPAYLSPDGYHPSGAGLDAYARLIARAAG